MASVFAGMYVKMIKIGKRSIDDVRPDELKEEVIDLLIGEGLYDLAGVKETKNDEEVEPETTEDEKNEDVPVEVAEDN